LADFDFKPGTNNVTEELRRVQALLQLEQWDLALGEVIGARGNRLAELRDVLLGARQARFRAPHLDDLFYPSPLNDSQLAAVRHVITAQDVGIVHGPPGTGKTTTLVQAILETIRRERRVLVCAPSNTAVDLLTEKYPAHERGHDPRPPQAASRRGLVDAQCPSLLQGAAGLCGAHRGLPHSLGNR
jgi:superfamily I DNA and/or RNA helicase